MPLKLQHVSTVHDMFGVWDITVVVNSSKEYVFSLKSEYDVEEFMKLYYHHPEMALNYLKRYCIRESKEEYSRREEMIRKRQAEK